MKGRWRTMRWKYTLNMTPVHHKATFTYTITLSVNLQLPLHIQAYYIGGKKLDNPEEVQSETSNRR